METQDRATMWPVVYVVVALAAAIFFGPALSYKWASFFPQHVENGVASSIGIGAAAAIGFLPVPIRASGEWKRFLVALAAGLLAAFFSGQIFSKLWLIALEPRMAAAVGIGSTVALAMLPIVMFRSEWKTAVCVIVALLAVPVASWAFGSLSSDVIHLRLKQISLQTYRPAPDTPFART